MTWATAILQSFRNLVGFGNGIGIEIAAGDLTIAAVRIRPRTVQVVGTLRIKDFLARSAAEWGTEYRRFLGDHGLAGYTATVLLPRCEVIMRQVDLPGVAPRDRESALLLQLDTLHPYADDAVLWGWSAIDRVAVLVGIVRRSVLERYLRVFAEANIAVSGFTFSAAVIRAAVHLKDGPRADLQEGFIAFSQAVAGRVEVYGESPSRPVLSAEFERPTERVALLAISELRLPPNTVPCTLNEMLPMPAADSVEHDLTRDARAYATAIVGAYQWSKLAVNLLPREYRRFSSHFYLFVTSLLAGLTLLMGGGMALYAVWSQHQYMNRLNAEISALEPRAGRATALNLAIANSHARAQLLNQFRGRIFSDLDAMNELTRLIDPPVWVKSMSLTRDSVHLSGEAPQAASLFKLLDSSSGFTNSVPDVLGRSNSGSGETFEIHSTRRTGK